MKTKYMTRYGFKGVSHREELAFDVLTHVCILTLVLTLFFWIVISPLAKKAVTGEIKKAINEAAQSLPSPNKNSTLQATLKTAANFYETPDRVTEKNNQWLLGVNVLVLLVLFGILAAGAFTIRSACGKHVPMKKLLLENLVLFGVIGFVEFLFFKVAGIKFVPVPPSEMAVLFSEKTKEKLQ
jgi:hypothetical protein